MSGVILKRTIYTMRHGQKEFGSDDPSLTKRGRVQAAEVACEHLLKINFDAIYHGRHTRHLQTARIAQAVAETSCRMFETPLLSLTSEMNDAANKCVMECLKHPDGPSVGFRVDTWFKTDTTLMEDCVYRFYDFLQQIPISTSVILAISSSPIIESVTYDREKTWLLGECGIIKYVIDDAGWIISSEVIFEGFFEKPPQKKS